MPKLFLFLAGAAGAIIGYPGSDILTGTGNGADHGADSCGGDDQLCVVAEHGEALLDIAKQIANGGVFHVGDSVGFRICQGGNSLREAEEADHRRDERDAGLQTSNAKGETGTTIDAINTNAGDQQTSHA